MNRRRVSQYVSKKKTIRTQDEIADELLEIISKELDEIRAAQNEKQDDDATDKQRQVRSKSLMERISAASRALESTTRAKEIATRKSPTHGPNWTPDLSEDEIREAMNEWARKN